MIVGWSQECNAIFNLIDYGDTFDLAVQSLALKRNIPLLMGGTFSMNNTIDIFFGKGCLFCSTDSHAEIR